SSTFISPKGKRKLPVATLCIRVVLANCRRQKKPTGTDLPPLSFYLRVLRNNFPHAPSVAEMSIQHSPDCLSQAVIQACRPHLSDSGGLRLRRRCTPDSAHSPAWMI